MRVLALTCLGALGSGAYGKAAATQPATRPGARGDDVAQQDSPQREAGPNTVYVCCLASPKAATIATLKDELKKAISNSAAKQSLNIVFTAPRRPRSWTIDGSLKPATAENKLAAQKFVDQTTFGPAVSPVAALDMAIKSGPAQVFLLMDQLPAESDAVLKAIRALEAHQKVAINTIAFDADDSTPAGADLGKFLGTIARETGGRYVRVRQSDGKP